jgi:hypothetical protein
MSDVLLERIAVALEALAASGNACAAAPVKAARKSKVDVGAESAKETVERAPDPVQPTAAPMALSVETRGFLEDDDEPVAAPTPPPEVPVLSEKDQRQNVRTKLIALQKALDPERALKVLKTAGGSETLIGLKPEKFQAVLDAIAAATPK